MTDSQKIEILSSHITRSRYAKFLQALQWRTNHVSVVLEDIYQGHNIAAVCRNCDAFGVQTVHIIENKYKVQANTNIDMGTSKWLTLVRHTSKEARVVKNGLTDKHKVSEADIANTIATLKLLRESGYALAASTLEGATMGVEDVPVAQPLAILIGTELTGLTAAAANMADYKFSMPMLGLAQSFNLSVFSALCLNSVCTRMRNSSAPWRLSKSQQDKLLLHWLTLCFADGGHSILASCNL